MKALKSYFRVMLGQKSIYAAECFAGSFIGTDFGIHQDLSNKLPEEWRALTRVGPKEPGRTYGAC
jgi:restriction system protein